MMVSRVDMKIFDSPASTILVTNSEGTRYAIVQSSPDLAFMKRLRSRRRGNTHVEIDPAVLDLDRKASGAALVGAGRFSVFERDDPVVQRTRHLAAVHDALAQRPALVRTFVLEREDLVAGRAEHRDFTSRRPHGACAPLRDRVQRADIEPMGGVLLGDLAHCTVSGVIRAM